VWQGTPTSHLCQRNSPLSRVLGILAQSDTLLQYDSTRTHRRRKDTVLAQWSVPDPRSDSLCALLVHRRPRRYIEIGSGNSTKFARKAIDAFDLETQVISIDPQPRAEMDKLCDQVLRIPAEDLPTSFIEAIGADDMLFIDNSRRAFPNSDVTVFFLEVLPGLPAGTLYGLHDIFLPNDYPTEWLNRHYSEQYMLGAYLLGGGDGDNILFPCNFVSNEGRDWPELAALIDATPLSSMPPWGGCFLTIKG